MKRLSLKMCVLFLFITTAGYCQVAIGVTRNVDIYKPYTDEAKEYMKSNEKVLSHTWSAYAQVGILKTSKWNWSAGISYQKIHHQIYDRILRYTYIAHEDQPTADTFYFYDPTDLISKSNRFGIRNEVSYLVTKKNKLSGTLGISNEIYFYELFKSEYEPFNEVTNKYSIQVRSLVQDTPRNFFLSSANFSVFYRETWHLSPAFRIAGKVNIGTNLYSDWDQFKKYLWLGVGLELGFGKDNNFQEDTFIE